MFSKTELTIIATWIVASISVLLLAFGVVTLTTIAIILAATLLAMIVFHGGALEFTSGFSDTEKDEEAIEQEQERMEEDEGYEDQEYSEEYDSEPTEEHE